MRCVSSGVLACLAVVWVAGAARAQQVGPVALELAGECVEAEALRAAAMTELGGRDVAVRVRVRCGASVAVEVTVASARAVASRQIALPAEEAGRLPEAVALIVGVAVAEWEEAVAAQPAPPAEPAREPPPEPEPEAQPPSPAPPEEPSPDDPQRVSVHAGAWLGERSPASGFAAELSVAWRGAAPVSIELGLVAALPRDVVVREGSLALFWYAARLSGCPGGEVARELWLGGCAGLALGALDTRASGFDVESLARTDPWLAADLRARAELSFDALSFRLDALLGVPLWTPTLVVSTQTDPRAVALDFAPVFGGVVAWVGLHFFP